MSHRPRVVLGVGGLRWCGDPAAVPGADSSAVLTVVNERLSRGAPASYRPNVSQVLDSARRGEWGTENVALRVRAAGYSEADARHVESSLNQES